MACRFEVVIEATDAAWARAAAEQALAEVTLWHTRLNRFDKASDISRINQCAQTRPVRVDGELFELLALCQRAGQVTGGMFNPLLPTGVKDSNSSASGACIAADGSDQMQRRSQTAVAAPVVPSLLLDAEAGTVQFVDSDAIGEVALDLGGIAKGWALDAAADSLVQSGVSLALLHGGTSSVRAIGTPPGMNGWAIQVGDGSAAPALVAGRERLIVHLADESLSISAHYGRPEGHVVHPRTGLVIHPDRHAGPEMAVVTCRSAAWAEVWSTALLLDPGLCAQGEQNAPHEQARFAAVRNTSAWNVCYGSNVGSNPAATAQLAATL